MIKFSIILQTHNSKLQLPFCLNSLLKQKEKNFEILIIDNASTDDTIRLAKVYEKNNPQIKLIEFSYQVSDSDIKNTALSNASGEYIIFLSVHSLFKKNFLASVINVLNNDPVDIFMVEYNTKFTPSSEHNLLRSPFCESKYLLQKNPECIFNLTNSFIENTFYRRQFLQDNKIKFSNIEFGSDFVFYIETTAKAKNIKLLRKSFIYYPKIINHFASRTLSGYQDISKAFKCAKDFLIKNQLYKKTKHSFDNATLMYLYNTWQQLPYPTKWLWYNYTFENIIKPQNLDIFERNYYTDNRLFEWIHRFQNYQYPIITDEKNIIPIVITSEDEFEDARIGVLIKSISKTADSDKIYDIYILCLHNPHQYLVDAILAMQSENMSINFVNCWDYLPKLHQICAAKVSKLYWLIPEILPYYEKAIYLKNNLIILQDISKLLQINLSQKLVAGVRDYANTERVENKLELVEETYINTNVIVFNISECRKQKLVNVFIRNLNCNKQCSSFQDIFNVSTKGKSVILPAEYNCKISLLLGRRFVGKYPYKISDVTILNYENTKPWAYLPADFSDIWWKHAKNSPLYEHILANGYASNIPNYQHDLMKQYIKHFFLRFISSKMKARRHYLCMKQILLMLAEN